MVEEAAATATTVDAALCQLSPRGWSDDGFAQAARFMPILFQVSSVLDFLPCTEMQRKPTLYLQTLTKATNYCLGFTGRQQFQTLLGPESK